MNEHATAERPAAPRPDWEFILDFMLGLRASRPLVLLTIVLSAFVVYLIGYAGGGIDDVYAHFMYVPIILGGLAFGIYGGVLTALAGGLLLGPFMPTDVALGESQQTVDWVVRTAFFMFIGLLNGAVVGTLDRRMRLSEWRARHNPDTGLPNRAMMLETLGQMNGSVHNSELFIVAATNLNDINAAFGIEAGDAIVRQLAERLVALAPGPASIFQHHPEQLSLIVSGAESRRPEAAIERIEKSLREPFAYDDVLLHVEPRIGYVPREGLAGSPLAQLRRAELAINHARQNDLDHHVYAPDLDGAARENMRTLGSLKQGIERNELCLHYQPKVSLKDRRLIGVEALVRWNSPDRGMMPPAMFIPQAEQSSLIHPLTEWVLETALSDLAGWIGRGLDLTLAINISTRNLMHPTFHHAVSRALERHQINPDRLELEVTETAVMRDPLRAAQLLARLSETRIVISIDDFGIGHSSLAYLSRLPASNIKIDREFIRRLRPLSGDAHIVDAAIHLAHSLEMKVIGEGVENEESLQWLDERGCDIAQGFHIGRPMSAPKLLEWIHAHANGNGNANGQGCQAADLRN